MSDRTLNQPLVTSSGTIRSATEDRPLRVALNSETRSGSSPYLGSAGPNTVFTVSAEAIESEVFYQSSTSRRILVASGVRSVVERPGSSGL